MDSILNDLLETIESLKQPCFLISSDFVPIDSEEDRQEGGFLIKEKITGLKHPLVLINPKLRDELIKSTKHRIRWITPNEKDWIDASERKLKEFTWYLC